MIAKIKQRNCNITPSLVFKDTNFTGKMAMCCNEMIHGPIVNTLGNTTNED